MKKLFSFLFILSFAVGAALCQNNVTYSPQGGYSPQQSYVRYTGNTNTGALPRPSVELAVGLQFANFKGSMYDPYYGIVEPLSPNPSLYVLYDFMVSVNIPIKQITENFYLGLNPNIGLGYSYGSQTFGGDLPLYLTLKYGAASFRGCQKPFGIGVGAGGMVSGLLTYLGDADGDAASYHTAYVSPSVMGEISFDLGYGNIYQIRTDFIPIPVSKNTLTYQGTISQVNIRLIRTF